MNVKLLKNWGYGVPVGAGQEIVLPHCCVAVILGWAESKTLHDIFRQESTATSPDCMDTDLLQNYRYGGPAGAGAVIAKDVAVFDRMGLADCYAIDEAAESTNYNMDMEALAQCSAVPNQVSAWSGIWITHETFQRMIEERDDAKAEAEIMVEEAKEFERRAERAEAHVKALDADTAHLAQALSTAQQRAEKAAAKVETLQKESYFQGGNAAYWYAQNGTAQIRVKALERLCAQVAKHIQRPTAYPNTCDFEHREKLAAAGRGEEVEA